MTDEVKLMYKLTITVATYAKLKQIIELLGTINATDAIVGSEAPVSETKDDTQRKPEPEVVNKANPPEHAPNAGKPAKQKRKRRTKAQIESDKRKAEAAKEPANAKTEGAEITPEPDNEKDLTEDDAREALNTVINSKGFPAAKAVLAGVGLARVTGMPADKYAALIDACKHAVAS